LRDDERYRFFASCWVIVLAPRNRSRCRHAATIVPRHPFVWSMPTASAISAGSMPWWVRKRESSAMMTMRWSTGEISRRAVGWTAGRLEDDPACQPSASLIIAVARGR